MSSVHDEPTIPPRLRRPLVALWISLGLHAALIALLQVAPPSAVDTGAPVIEVRLVTQAAAEAVPATPPEPARTEVPETAAPQPSPVATPDAVPVSAPVPEASEPESSEPERLAEPPPSSAPAPVPAPMATPPAPMAITSAVDLNYYSAHDLDVQPRALRAIEPDYPPEADRRQLSGTVRLQLRLEADGRVSDVALVSASPPGWFEDSALRAFRDARFSPAQKNGRPVRALMLIEVEYDWEGRR